MAERANWLQRPYTDDKFASALLEAGISSSVIDAWTKDPQVPDPSSGKKGSLWDQLEDLDTSACLQKCVDNGPDHTMKTSDFITVHRKPGDHNTVTVDKDVTTA